MTVIGPVPGSSEDRQVRPLVLDSDAARALVALCGSVSAAETLATEILAEWLRQHATTNRMAAVAAAATEPAHVFAAA